ncbi:MAG: hypothetical protein FJ276_13980 [Planctomycetes bacterium]|nr:hypothetical protein [Planctomycetota bacterium]
MKGKRSLVVAGLSLSAAIALSTAAAQAADGHRTGVDPVPAVSKVGKVVPINLLSGAKEFSSERATGDCCGPYHQKCCPRFVG